MGAIAQMEWEIKAERAAARRAAAKARGKTGGRPRTDQDKLEQARILYQNSKKSAAEVCKLFGFSRRTLFNHLTAQKANSRNLAVYFTDPPV
jgi:DNA invertase Pin-like site-specific DNA recombinase